MTEELIAGRFRISGLLGSGGTASVFAADDALSGESVALKVLHPHLASQRAAHDAFFEEVRAARSISHPGLAYILDAGVVESEPPLVWIAMERVAGLTLAEVVREQGPLAAVDAAVLIIAVLDALAAAHAGGVVHRDVTPANVMFDPALVGADSSDPVALRGSVRLLDFGLADVPGRTSLAADALLSTAADSGGSVVASVPYASPEQLSGGAITEASDIYQVGGVLHFAVTGRAPFSGATDAVVRAHLMAPPPVPSVTRPGLPRPIDRVVTTAMLKRPGDRYADVVEMRAALDEFVNAVDAAAALSRTPPADAASHVRQADEFTQATRVYPGISLNEPPPLRDASPVAASRAADSRRAWGLASAIALITVIVGASALAAAMTPGPQASASPQASALHIETSPATAPDDSTDHVTVEVPEVVGLTAGDARRALEGAGLSVGEVAFEDSPALGDLVLGSTPTAGERVRSGVSVDMRVASGSNLVPPTVGLPAAEAAALLNAHGFSSTIVDVVVTGNEGLVVTSSPGAGQRASVGAIVVLSVARAAPVVTPTPSPSAPSTVPPTPLPSAPATPTP